MLTQSVSIRIPHLPQKKALQILRGFFVFQKFEARFKPPSLEGDFLLISTTAIFRNRNNNGFRMQCENDAYAESARKREQARLVKTEESLKGVF